MTQIRPVQDLTYGQQKMLRIILQLPQKPFQTSDVLAISHDFTDNLSASAVVGSLANLGYLHKLASGRDKRWCVAQQILMERQQLLLDLREVVDTSSASVTKETTPVSSDDIIEKILNTPRRLKS